MVGTVGRRSTWLLVVVLAGLVMVAGAGTATAQEAEPVARSGSLLITEGPIAIGPQADLGVVVVTSGDALVAGSVETIIVADGDLTVSGDVDSLAWAVTGDLTLAEGGAIGGDAIAAGTLDVDAGTVGGETRQVTAADWAWTATMFGLLWWIGLAIAMFVLGLVMIWLAPRGVAAAREVGRTRVGPALGVGLALMVGLPLVAVLVAFTVVGLPLTIGLLLTTMIAAFVGHVVAALVVGRVLLRGAANPVLDLVVGLVVLGALGLLPFVGGVVTGLAAVYGVGAIMVAVWEARTAPTVITIPEAAAPQPQEPAHPDTPPPTARA